MLATAEDGVRIWWEDAGDGPPVLLGPGRGDDADLFPLDLREGLVDAGFRVIRYDPRDAGLSDDGGDDYTLSTMADDVIAVLDAADAHAAHLVGFSMSGLVVVDLMSRHPDRALSLTFLSAMSPDPDAGFGDQLFADHPDPVEATLAGMGSPSESDREWVAANHELAKRRAPTRPEAGERHNAAAFRLGWPTLSDLGAIKVPTLVVHGAAGRSLPVAHAHAFARAIAETELHVLPGMGHIPTRNEWEQILERMISHGCGQGDGYVSVDGEHGIARGR